MRLLLYVKKKSTPHTPHNFFLAFSKPTILTHTHKHRSGIVGSYKNIDRISKLTDTEQTTEQKWSGKETHERNPPGKLSIFSLKFFVSFFFARHLTKIAARTNALFVRWKWISYSYNKPYVIHDDLHFVCVCVSDSMCLRVCKFFSPFSWCLCWSTQHHHCNN